jgi:hypothetical protein
MLLESGGRFGGCGEKGGAGTIGRVSNPYPFPAVSGNVQV